MEDKQKELEKLTSKIIDIEWEMFHSVIASEPNSCQENKNTFQLMRWMSYSVLDEELLNAIYDNIHNSVKEGRNLMTEKYGRMEELIPPIKESPLIQEIASAEQQWMEEVAAKYPITFKGGNEKFLIYIKCELETYSDKLLELYSAFIKRAQNSGINLIEERYNNLFRRIGYESIADKESKERHKEFWKQNTCRGC